MNTLPQRKTLIQCVLTMLAPFLIASCGGDSSGGVGAGSDAATTVKKRELTSYMYTDRSSQPLKGNGIWNYSVATDYYYGSQNPPKSPSLAVDLKSNSQANIEYVFATFISLSLGYDGNKTLGFIPTIREECPTDKVVPIIAYYALPLINPDIYPTTPSPLGGCVAGKTATAYYAGIFPDAPLKVVPVAEYADDNFPTFMSNASDEQIISIATALAQAIVNDQSTYGLAIDNEKSINGFNTTMSSSGMTVGQENEELFFGTLAAQLGVGGKYLFLFDAATSAKDLYANNHTNVVILSPLYDLDNSDPAVTNPVPYNPDPLSQYTASLTRSANGALTASAGVGQSVMYVVPASATSTIWDYEMAYNYPLPTTKPTYASPILNTPSITTNNQGNCSSLARDSMTDTVLSALISQPNTINDFLGTGNCYLFTNTTTPNKLNDYFSASLKAITAARTQSNLQANYLGAALYAWRISGANDMNAVKNYPSLYTSNGVDTKVVYLPGPPDIQNSSWATFNTWAPANK